MATSGNHKKTVLVTGANGQLGRELRDLSANFAAYDFLFTSNEELPIEEKSSVDLFFDKHLIHYCINCAAYTAVDKAETEEAKAFLINRDGPGFLADACRKHHVKFIHISTDYVYDEGIRRPLKEDDALAPLSVYGLSKLKGEEAALQTDPSALVIRTSWVYAAYGNNFVKTMLRLFKEKESLNVINDQVGCPTYAADLAAIILKFVGAMESGKKYEGIVNYCNDGITTWYDFAVAIKEFVDSPCIVRPIPTSQYPTPAKRPKYSVLDTSKIKSTLAPDIPFWKDSLHKCLVLLSKQG